MNNNKWKIGDIVVDFGSKKATFADGEDISITDLQSKILKALVCSSPKTVKHDELYEKAWNKHYVDDKAYSSAMSKLRKKMGWQANVELINEHGIGYRLNLPCTPLVEVSNNPMMGQRQSNQQDASRWFVSIMAITLICLIWWQLTPSHEATPVNAQNVKALTHLKGIELRPDLSPDGKYLAFNFSNRGALDYEIKVKHLETQRVLSLPEQGFHTSPKWNNTSQYLYYATYQDQQCWLKRVKLIAKFEFSAPEKLVYCGVVASESQPQIDLKDEWLYFAYIESLSTAYAVKRVNLLSPDRPVETLTTAIEDGYGDYSISLSPDDSKLAILNSDGSAISRLSIMDLDTKDRNTIFQFGHLMFNPAWTADSENIIYASAAREITVYNLPKRAAKMIMTLPDRAYTLARGQAGNVLAGYGNIYKANIYAHSLSDTNFEPHNLVSTSFNDRLIAPMSADNSVYAFVSNRSGRQQIWLSDEGNLKQLSQFEDSKHIETMLVTPNGQQLIFVREQNLYKANLNDEFVPQKIGNREIYRNVSLGCDGETIYASSKINDSWNILELDLNSNQESLLYRRATGLKVNCETHTEYIVYQGKTGIYVRNKNDQESEPVQILAGVSLLHHSEWDMTNDTLYYYVMDGLYALNLRQPTEKPLRLSKQRPRNIKVKFEHLYFDKDVLNDTYIAEISLGSN